MPCHEWPRRRAANKRNELAALQFNHLVGERD